VVIRNGPSVSMYVPRRGGFISISMQNDPIYTRYI
jgi:hypothetical protein